MFYRDRIFLLSISLLSSPLFSSDPKENPNIEYVTTTYEGGLGVLPKSPELEPEFLGTNKRPIPSNVGSSTGGSILNLIRAFVGPSEKELKRDREIEELNQQLSSSMTKRGKQIIGGIPRPNNDYSVESLTKAIQNSANQPSDPFTCYPGMPQPTPKVEIPVVPKFVATKSLTFTMGNAKKASDFLDIDNAQKTGEVAEKFSTSMASPSPFPDSSGESSGSNGLAGLAGGGALLAQGATLAAPPATTATVGAGGGTVATTSWGATLGGYAWAAAPWVAVGSAAFAVGIGIGMLRDRIYYPELTDWWPTPEQRAAVLANREVEKAKQVQKTLNNTSTSTGSPNPKKPEDNKKGRITNQVQRTEAMDKIKQNYRYDKQKNKYILKDNGTPIKCTRTGKDVIGVDWDGAHGDIEAYGKKHHLGSLNPETFEMYKGPAGDGRTL